MTLLLFLAAVLPGLLWNGDPGSAETLKQVVGVRLYVPPEGVDAWRAAGFDARSAAGLSGYEELKPPRLAQAGNVASATTVPWIDANGWRFLRGTKRVLYRTMPPGTAPLAAAEAFAYDIDAVLEPAPGDVPGFLRMLAFLRTIQSPPLPTLANLAIVDDGTPLVGEVLNLLTRRNLLYRVVRQPDPAVPLNVKIGSREFPAEAAEDPNQFAALIRKTIGDDRRLVRLFGSYTVLAHLSGDARHARLHLLNYSTAPVADLRVRVLGRYVKVTVAADHGPEPAADYAIHEGGTEFTIRKLQTYAVAELINTGR